MHPHGVKYNPEYDGAYMGEFTRAGGFIAPGETFTYQWECTPDSVGAWPYHDHGPNHTLNTFRGLFGAIVIRPRGAKRPDRLYTVFAHQLPPPVTGLDRNFQCLNGRAYAGNTPTLRARVGQDVEINAFGMDSNFHTFHIHGHRWKDPAGAYVDNPAMGPNESVTARFVEDNPGRWLYHCHVFTHQDTGMTGWYVVDP
jgi:FtsP/CotA-like multicopper oxidase with cupredoxin domain